MRVQVLGPGCAKCAELAKRTEAAIHGLGLDLRVEKVTDVGEMLKFGVLTTPALALDGKVVVAGRVLTEAELRSLLATATSQGGRDDA